MSNEIQSQVDKIVIDTYKRVEKQLDFALDKCARSIIQSGKTTPFEISGALEKQVNKIFNEFTKNSYETVKSGIGKSWELSNDTYDKLLNNKYALKKYITDKLISPALKDAMFNHNKIALDAYINRGLKGTQLSDRIWNVREVAQNELGLLMNEGLAFGKSAAELSRDVRHILKEPNKLFRRVKDENGVMQLSKAARNYHPGQGVYRSSYQNALRLTGSEVNIAYETAQYTRHQKMDFVTGFEVKLSNNHLEEDICDHLKGEYPKTFKFKKWHPRCRCHSVPIMLNEDEFMDYLDTGEVPQNRIVKNIPKGASDYVAKNKKTFNGLKSKPYFLTDNKQFFQEIKPGVISKPVVKAPVKPVEDTQKLTDYFQVEGDINYSEYGNIIHDEKYNKLEKYYNDQQDKISNYINTEKGNILFKSVKEYKVEGKYYEGNYQAIRDYLTDKKSFIETNISKSVNYRVNIKDLDKRIDNISKFIDNNPVNDNIIINRRINTDNCDFFSKLDEGDIYMDKSFVSTSLRELKDWGNFNIKIIAKKGTKLACTYNDREFEFLIQKNSKFKVLAKSKNQITVELL